MAPCRWKAFEENMLNTGSPVQWRIQGAYPAMAPIRLWNRAEENNDGKGENGSKKE